MRVAVTHECPDFGSYRAALVKSLYNVDAGNRVSLEADRRLRTKAGRSASSSAVRFRQKQPRPGGLGR
jgi:hypothetical protein